MNELDFDHFCALVMQRTGLVLGRDKAYLVDSRLKAIARTGGLKGVAEVLAAIRAGTSPGLADAAINAMNTHESLFFRDGLPFEQLGGLVLDQILRSKPVDAPLRIWSAACSCGQEPYSIAILLAEQQVRLAGRRVEILATDVSETILAKARVGAYSDFEVNRGLSPERRNRWMRKQGEHWEMSPQIKSMVMFRQHNLLEAPVALGAFDIVFCRNVLIYFNMAGKAKALDAIARAMTGDGFLFLGSAESTSGLSDAFHLVSGQRGLASRSSGPLPLRQTA